MKRLAFLVISVLALAGLLSGCASAPQIKEYTSASQAIVVDARDQFTIVLESNPTTGYKWDPSYDSNLLKVVKSDYKQSEAKPGMVGVGGKEYFTFEAIKKGESKITMTYKRSWEQGSADQKVFNVAIK
jgi:inhibitor of cysteine peptidase